MAVNTAVKGVKNSDPCHISAPVRALMDVLDTLSKWVDQVPPTKQSLRYGNPAYK
jgi:serine/threonine-protein phosphatase 2A activator